jgi:hypothetical protein
MSSQHVMILDEKLHSLHLHNRALQEVCHVGRQELGLQGPEQIWAMGCGQGDVMHLFVYDRKTHVFKLIAYQVSAMKCTQFAWVYNGQNKGCVCLSYICGYISYIMKDMNISQIILLL